ncbi:unnamed protein product [Rotaria sordida]|uniref:Uncharacterized protein n=1 Tax=Rotaria sordida TaxID=392033 RepID=A0A818NGW0_9BILA|nr:unnamed protein product [Rotaria sordida]
MSTLFSPNYNDFYSQPYFGFPAQKNNYYYDRDFLRQQSMFLSYHPFGGFPTTGYHQFGRSIMNTELMQNRNQSNDRYQHKQYMPHTNMIQNSYWQQRANVIPLPMYTRSFPLNYAYNTPYSYEKGMQSMPYKVHVERNNADLGVRRNLGYGYYKNLAYPAGSKKKFANIDGNMNLSSNVNMTFTPIASPPFQPLYDGPLCMPPFLFNRMSPPFTSLPLPPPLPDLKSLPVTPVVQQMVRQQYANPIAVIPFTPNWLISQPMISYHPQLQDMQKQSMISTSTLPSFQFSLQPYVRPNLRWSSMPLLPTDSSNLSHFSNSILTTPQYTNSNYSNMCRACPPMPPLLNIPVTNYHWVHHCSACHRAPADFTKSNIRSTKGRITPLLRRPMVPQHVDNRKIRRQQQQQYPHIHTSVTTHPWLYNMPPHPPDAVINSKKFVPRNHLSQAHYYSQKYQTQSSRVTHSVLRSATTNTMSDNRSQTNKDSLEKQQHKNTMNDNKSQSSNNSNGIQSKSSSSTSNTNRSSTPLPYPLCNLSPIIDHEKSDIISCKTQKSISRKQLSTEVHNASHFYNYQPVELIAVYHYNRRFKSSNEDSTTPSKSSVSSNLCIDEDDKENSPPLSIHCHSMKEEEEEEESQQDEEKYIHVLSPTPFQLEEPKNTPIIVQEFLTRSLSTISTVSSSTVFSIIDDDLDSFSITSMTKEDTYEDNKTTPSETVRYMDVWNI